jgi:hypothetical protein
MKEVMKIRIVISALFFLSLSFISTMSAVAYGQAVPAGIATIDTAPNPLPLDGVFHYALSASEILQLGYYAAGRVTGTSALSGDVAYSSKNTARPFSMIFAGGLLLPNQSGQGVTTYESLSASQGYVTRHWVFNLTDSFSFLPQSPTTGLSGIPGVGDIGVIPTGGPGEGAAGGVLTVSGNRIGNSLSGSAERQITPNTSISGAGSWTLLRFVDSQADGLNYSQASGTAAVNHRFDSRTSASVNAVYSVFDYTGYQSGPTEPNFQSRGINLSFQRLLSRTLSVSASAGPEWISSSNGTLIPSTLNVAGNASLTYSRRFTNVYLTYSRGVNGGSGVLPGALSDSFGFGGGRTYGRNWVLSISGAYTRSSGLTDLAALNSLQGVPTSTSTTTPVHEVFDTIYAGVQARRRITTNLSGFLSYTAQNQSTNYSYSLSVPNTLSGTSQTFGIGISFAPRSTSLGQF